MIPTVARPHSATGGADHRTVAEHVRVVLGVVPPAVEASPVDDLPLDPLNDLAATRAVLRRLDDET